MIFFERERSQVRTLRVSFREIARIFGTLGGFNLGWYWLSNINEPDLGWHWLGFCEFFHANSAPLASVTKKHPFAIYGYIIANGCF